jgi:signal transduction histidine kinase
MECREQYAQKTLCDHIDTQLFMSLSIIADLFDISKITAGTMALDFAEVDLKRIVSSSVETLRVQAEEKSITLEKFFAFSAGIDCRIWGDEVRLQQILTNILSNSLKFTSKGWNSYGASKKSSGDSNNFGEG